MNIYLFSNGRYFSRGLTHLFYGSRQDISARSRDDGNPRFIQCELHSGDILLLDASSPEFIKKSLFFPIIQSQVTVFIFFDRYKRLLPVFSRWPHAAKNLSYQALQNILPMLNQQPLLQTYCPCRLFERDSGFQTPLRQCPQLPHRPGSGRLTENYQRT
jgi:hypothetical protein